MKVVIQPGQGRDVWDPLWGGNKRMADFFQANGAAWQQFHLETTNKKG